MENPNEAVGDRARVRPDRGGGVRQIGEVVAELLASYRLAPAGENPAAGRRPRPTGPRRESLLE